MIPRYRPRRLMTTYSGRPRLLWRTFDDEGNWTGHHVTKEAAWLAMGFVARCACGHAYTAEGWAELELVGDIDGVLEQRNCVCGSTISREKG
jgi:hypothetical protein